MNEPPLSVGSLFAGIGGFELGLEQSGMICEFQVEIELFPIRVLETHWPDVKRFKDVKDVGASNLPRVDVLTGGFPCQDLSVAGRRAGLAGERSGLFYEFARITEELRPHWIIVENVPGLFSSAKGKDFQIVLESFAELGYALAWRVLDSQYFGVPQRRRRVFIVGCLGDPRGAGSVLFEPESCEGDPAAIRRTRDSFALSASGTGTSRTGRNKTRVVAPTLSTKNEVASSSSQRQAWMEQSVELFGTVRRLTPLECERLQGFPDFWTAIDGERTPDAPRYKAIGNAVTVPVARWIGERIVKYGGRRCLKRGRETQ